MRIGKDRGVTPEKQNEHGGVPDMDRSSGREEVREEVKVRESERGRERGKERERERERERQKEKKRKWNEGKEQMDGWILQLLGEVQGPGNGVCD